MREEEGGRRDAEDVAGTLGGEGTGVGEWTVAEPPAGWTVAGTQGGYRDLVVWQKAMAWTEQVYAITRRLPSEERFGLSSQLRRSAVSVPSNIAEGWGRGSKAEYAQFLRYARGSLFEAQTQIELARRLGFADAPAAERALTDADEISRMLLGLARSQR